MSGPVDVEGIKARSRLLRGTLQESLADPTTRALAPDDTHVLKFHGSYQQDDRDLREERRVAKLEPAYSFMLRTRLPGGVCTPAQWLLLDELARTYGNGGLRLTTRQAFQLHGVVKPQLKATMQGLHRELLDTFAACGDVNRNVMAPTHAANPIHDETLRLARELSAHLLPKTKAYSEIWLDGAPTTEDEEEPIYGERYLPRKFKVAIAVPPCNDVDVFAHDLGFIGVIEDGRLVGWNVTIGGGMGATHGDPTTHPRLADVAGFVTPEQALAVAEHVVTVQRDHGDRANRKHARLKYTVEKLGLAAFVAEVERRSGVTLQPARPFAFTHNRDRFGWGVDAAERHHVTLHVESGRLLGDALDGLAAIARQLPQGEFRLTPNQNLVIAGIDGAARPAIEALLARHGLEGFRTLSPIRTAALACVALPTCALAMAEAERALPSIGGAFEALLQKHDLRGLELHLRVTGCPNGCARPYLAELALVGKGPGSYNLHLGGSRRGDRLNTLHRENVSVETAVEVVDALLGRYCVERVGDEGFGDWSHRAVVGSA